MLAFGSIFLWGGFSILADRQEWFAGPGILHVRNYCLGVRMRYRTYAEGRLFLQRWAHSEGKGYSWSFYLLHKERKRSLDFKITGKDEQPTELIQAAMTISQATGWPLEMPSLPREIEPIEY
jgi:hypothetical protein